MLQCIPIAAYPFVTDRNAARLDHNPMSPVPREPVTTIVERTGKKLRAVIFDGGSPSPDVSRTVHIPQIMEEATEVSEAVSGS